MRVRVTAYLRIHKCLFYNANLNRKLKSTLSALINLLPAAICSLACSEIRFSARKRCAVFLAV